MFQNIGELMVLLWRTLNALPAAVRQRRKIFDQLFEIGNASLLMACILSLFIGGVIALQTGPCSPNAGSRARSAAWSACPFAGTRPRHDGDPDRGRIGSAMAAEIGSMRVYREIDALRTMNINPIHYLVLPRMIAISIALPILVIFAILIGWFGAAWLL